MSSSSVLRQRGLELYVINTATNGYTTPQMVKSNTHSVFELGPSVDEAALLERRNSPCTTVVSPCSHVRP